MPIDELHFGPRTYSPIRVGEPIQSHEGVFRVPGFDERSFLWNLIELHPELSMLPFTVASNRSHKLGMSSEAISDLLS